MALVLPRDEIFLWGRNFCRIILGILAALLAAKTVKFLKRVLKSLLIFKNFNVSHIAALGGIVIVSRPKAGPM